VIYDADEIYHRAGYTRHAHTPQAPTPPTLRTLGGDQPYHAQPVELRPLRWHVDARGALVEAHRESWHRDVQPGAVPMPRRGEVAQVYLSTTAEGVVKGWHLHARQHDRFVVVQGAVLLALYDVIAAERAQRLGHTVGLQVHEVVLHPQRNPAQVVVPPGWAHGWMALPGYGEAVVLNAVSIEYDGTDEWRRDAHAGPFDGVGYLWRRSRDG